MKNLLMLPFAFISFLVFAGPIEDEIIARIHQPGAVCLQGEACASAQSDIGRKLWVGKPGRDLQAKLCNVS